mmetsp:Transcript_47532/g.82720  ORF Transcript_47532/g.82720 Transcript_47532/m.82720 type:complete len:81 (-) Transcript_47532:1315-1557(-)
MCLLCFAGRILKINASNLFNPSVCGGLDKYTAYNPNFESEIRLTCVPDWAVAWCGEVTGAVHQASCPESVSCRQAVSSYC